MLLLAESALALGNAADALRMAAGAELFISRAGWRQAACRVHRLRARAEALRGDARAALAALRATAPRRGLASGEAPLRPALRRLDAICSGIVPWD
ncbi:hypothetical protein WMF18_33135 [Sorangium sp. So ce315]|uniref:hypothetical protein n=1 Tax=Sorangium sp. So ce315 TaxID=3133299 RepID=UPI003F620F12